MVTQYQKSNNLHGNQTEKNPDTIRHRRKNKANSSQTMPPIHKVSITINIRGRIIYEWISPKLKSPKF